jgi:drug/metabolite transporter (DMT)-like permease
MDISPAVMLAVLAAALLHAGWNALLKASPDKDLEIAALALSRGTLALLALPWVAAPAAASLPWIVASVAVHVLYFWALAGAYRYGDLSFTYPIMRGGAPVLVTLVGVALLGEVLSWQEAGAVALICVGIIAFASRPSGAAAPARQALLFALGNALVIACYTLIDSQGVRLSGSAPGYAIWLMLANSVVQAAIGLAARGRAVTAYAARHWRRVLVGGFFTLLSYPIVLWAMTRAPVALVAVLRETSVLFAAVLGALFLGERFTPRRLVATGAVLAGLMALRL